MSFFCYGFILQSFSLGIAGESLSFSDTHAHLMHLLLSYQNILFFCNTTNNKSQLTPIKKDIVQVAWYTKRSVYSGQSIRNGTLP